MVEWADTVYVITSHENMVFTDCPSSLSLSLHPASKRGSADEASKLRDIVLKPKEQSQPQKWVQSIPDSSFVIWYMYCELFPLRWVETLEEIPSLLYPGLVSSYTSLLIFYTTLYIDYIGYAQFPGSVAEEV